MELIKNIMMFFRSLTPSFERKKVVDEARGTLKEIRDATIKTVSLLTDDIAAESKLWSVVYKTLTNAGFGGKSPNEGILEVLSKLIKNEDKIITMIENTFNTYALKEALDYEKLNILQYTNAISFFNKYTRKYTIALIAEEKRISGSKLSVIERNAISFCLDNDNIKAYGICAKALITDVSHIVKILKELRGIQVTEGLNEKSVGLRVGAIDPFKMGFLPVQLNPAYYMGLAYNEWKAYEYESATLGLEKTKLELIALSEGDETDPVIAKQIKYYNGRLAKLQSKIEEIEEDL